jgi:hypothetical protein
LAATSLRGVEGAMAYPNPDETPQASCTHNHTHAEQSIEGLFDGLSVTATTSGSSATISLTGYSVSAADVGKFLVVRGGRNFIIGTYLVASMENASSNSWTLDRPCTIGDGYGMIGRLVTQEGSWHDPVPEYFDQHFPDNPGRGEARQKVLEALLVVAPDVLKSLAAACFTRVLLEPEMVDDHDWPGPSDYLLWGHVRDAGRVLPGMGLLYGNLRPLKAALIGWAKDEPRLRWNLCGDEDEPVEWVADAALQTLVYWQERGRLPKNLHWANLDLFCYGSLNCEEAYRMFDLERHFDAGSGFVRVTPEHGEESSRFPDREQRKAKREYKSLGQKLGLTRMQGISARYFAWYAMRTFLGFKLREIREQELQRGVSIGDPKDPNDLSAIAMGIRKVADLVGFHR